VFAAEDFLADAAAAALASPGSGRAAAGRQEQLQQQEQLEQLERAVHLAGGYKVRDSRTALQHTPYQHLAGGCKWQDFNTLLRFQRAADEWQQRREALQEQEAREHGRVRDTLSAL
jgi:hypothetical protein